MDIIKFDFKTIIYIIKCLYRGKSIARTLSDIIFENSNICLDGKIIDLGAKSASASYYETINLSKVKKIDYVDFYRSGENIIKMNLEEPFNLKNEVYDYVICYSVLEHIFNYQNVLNESNRILKDNGIFIGFVPFMYGYHPDPNDYFRFSSVAIERIFSNASFTKKHITMVGYGPFTLFANSLSGHIPKIIRPIIAISFFLDWIFYKISNVNKEKFAIGYFFIYKK